MSVEPYHVFLFVVTGPESWGKIGQSWSSNNLPRHYEEDSAETPRKVAKVARGIWTKRRQYGGIGQIGIEISVIDLCPLDRISN